MHTVVLIAFNSHTKFEISSFIRCKDMTGAPKFRNWLRDFDDSDLGCS